MRGTGCSDSWGPVCAVREAEFGALWKRFSALWEAEGRELFPSKHSCKIGYALFALAVFIKVLQAEV